LRFARPRHREDVEYAVGRHRRWREAQEAPVGLDVGHGDQHRIVGHEGAAHLHADRRQWRLNEVSPGHRVVREPSEQSSLELAPVTFDRSLDLLQGPVAPMREEEIIADAAHVDMLDLATLQDGEDRLGRVDVAERRGELVAEAVRDGNEGDSQPQGRTGCAALRAVAAHAGKMGEGRVACRRPAGEAVEIGKSADVSVIATCRERPPEASRRDQCPSLARPRRDDELNPRTPVATISTNEAQGVSTQ